MTTQNQPASVFSKPSSALVAGGVLLSIGLFSLVGQFVDLDSAGVFVLSAIFLAWGLLARKTGLVIPGGILAGVGLGTVLTNGAFSNTDGMVEGGIFLLSLAAGFVIVSLASIFTSANRKMVTWPFIPASILAVVGAAEIASPSLDTLLQVAKYSPVILIVVGLYLIVKR
jgi:hypothetical protein